MSAAGQAFTYNLVGGVKSRKILDPTTRNRRASIKAKSDNTTPIQLFVGDNGENQALSDDWSEGPVCYLDPGEVFNTDFLSKISAGSSADAKITIIWEDK